MATLGEGMAGLLGLEAETVSIGQMALRALVVYIVALAMVRLGEKRFLGKNTAFDVILAIMFGSVVSRAIINSSPFFPTLGAGLVLVLLHWLFASLAFRSDRLGSVIKGQERLLIKDGEIQWDAMRRSHISERDLRGALRAKASVMEPDEVEVAYLERSGEISAITRDKEPRVVEVRVADGVQTVRIEVSR